MQKILNDFAISIATVNGSGSQTANSTLLRAFFKMGIPASGKNLFPSNIQGLPTWYLIRVSKDGFTARKDISEISVAINPATFMQDLQAVPPGGAFFYADDIRLPIGRSDISLYPMPVKQISREADIPANLKDYVANMVYVGVLAQMLGIPEAVIHESVSFQFKGKEKATEVNMTVVRASMQWAAQNLTKSDPFAVEPMDKTRGLLMTDGNTAAALGAIYGGLQFAAWYPITPSSSLAETLNQYLPKLRKTNDGKNTYAVLQAEDELAAIGMAIGAGWAGLRSMTATSGPGLSLMTEYAGLAYFAEVPVVIWDIQRAGPSTGLPTRTAQGDLTMVNFLSHGDTQHVILLPGNLKECFEFGWQAFDLAERLQAPIFVLSDLDLGMNQWMSEPFEYPNRPMDRGKILWEEDLEKLNGIWARYKDVDGDGIPYRTVPGNLHPAAAWFARGAGHDETSRYSEDPQIWESNLLRIRKKYETAKQYLPAPLIDESGQDIGLIAYGSVTPAVEEARVLLASQSGVRTDFLRLRALPCTQEVHDFVQRHQRIYFVEANRDGQLRQLASMSMPQEAHKFRSACHTDGLPITARWVADAILAQEEK